MNVTNMRMAETFVPASPEECFKRFERNDSNEIDGAFCKPTYDLILCWPSVPAGQIAWTSCWPILQYGYGLSVDVNQVLQPEPRAYRACGEDGKWLWGNWSNYSECMDFTMDIPKAPLTISLILLICSLVSLFFLSVTIFIFFYFKSLQCSRLRVHRNLVVALIIHSLMLVVISLPVVGGASIPSYKDISWLCKAVVAVKLYAALSSISWMFVEGMLLHSRITTKIFQKDAPFKLFYLMGWGVPFILIISWCTTMTKKIGGNCWEGYGRSPYVWMITGPMIFALGINLIFLINIIRILCTKMKRSSTFEIIQVRRAFKATAFLFPLLGITHLFFCINPQDDSKLEEVYMIANATLQSSQGIFVSVLYCFMNIEVQTVLRKAYVRSALRRNPNHRYTWKCRTTRASQTSTFVSNCDMSGSEPSLARSVSSARSVYVMRDMRRLDSPYRCANGQRCSRNEMSISDV